MSERNRPRVDIVQASYYRREKCEVCGKTTERNLTFTGSSLADCNRQAEAWEARPLRHKKCEWAI